MNNSPILNQLDSYPDIMTIDKAAEYLQLGKSKVYDLLTSGDLKGYKMGKAWRISKSNIIEYMKKIGLL